ncbi:hypothetical protein S40285_10409 [Stachybotrys chlorohalonatus IBT 40285]|uniref:Uncharacterized protein n=1 Tax=Stachybotrys chlorohalonatus (strain IBT 40285) TaxID=1283841 RepID=A0A084QGF6_STAC4|nr:hypothetical protein S40285_10409 [Stachybotrys chlorohalonata IBT 40285]
MYVHYPEPGADLVPLPEFEGSKLEPFIFQRKWMVEILEGLGSGMHSWVFKVRIDGQIYAPKLFCFTDEVYLPSYPLHHWKKDYSKVVKTDKIKNDAWSGFRLRWRLKDGMLYAECFGPEKE